MTVGQQNDRCYVTTLEGYSPRRITLVPRPPTLQETRLGTTPLLQDFEFTRGSLCDFHNISHVCLDGTDSGGRNVTKTIVAALAGRTISIGETCRGIDGLLAR